MTISSVLVSFLVSSSCLPHSACRVATIRLHKLLHAARAINNNTISTAAQCVQGFHDQASHASSHRTCNPAHTVRPWRWCCCWLHECGVKQQCVQGCHDQVSQAASHRTCNQQQHYLHGCTRRQLYSPTVCLALSLPIKAS